MTTSEAALLVGCLAFVGVIITGVISFIAARNTKATKIEVVTGNGHTLGQSVEKVVHDVGELRLWLVEHLRDHANRAEDERSRR